MDIKEAKKTLNEQFKGELNTIDYIFDSKGRIIFFVINHNSESKKNIEVSKPKKDNIFFFEIKGRFFNTVNLEETEENRKMNLQIIYA